MPWANRRYRRLIWLLGVLAVVLIAAFTQRSRLASIPNRYASQLIRSRDFSGAQWWQTVSHRIAPHNAEGEFIKSRIQRHFGDLDGARTCLARAEQSGLSPIRVSREEWLIDVQAGNLNHAEQRLAQLLADAQGDELEICDVFVSAFLEANNLLPAETLLSLWEKDFPRDPQPLFHRASLLRDRRRWNEAQLLLERALELNPQHGSSNLLLGQVLLDNKQPSSALLYFDRAATDPANRAAATLGKAKSLAALGNGEPARAILVELLHENLEILGATVTLAQLEMSEGDYPSALGRLEPLLSRHGRDLDLRYAYGIALRGVGRADEGSRVLEAFSNSRVALERAAKLRLQVDQDPENIPLRLEIGRISLTVGDEKEGLKWLQTVLNREPGQVEAHRLLADYYYQHRAQNARFVDLARQHAELADGTGSK